MSKRSKMMQRRNSSDESPVAGEFMTDMRQNPPKADVAERGDSAGMLHQQLSHEINRLERLSRRGPLALALFLGVSILAWLGFGVLPAPETVTAVLGSPPSARMVSIVLVLYTFSALALSLTRMTAGIEHRSSFSHVGYLTAFYLFYYYGSALAENYWAVFGAGITILGVESYRIRTFCADGITRSREDMEFVLRTGRPPPRE